MCSSDLDGLSGNVHAYNNNAGSLIIEVSADRSLTYQVQVFDALGKKVIDDHFISDPGSQKVNFDISKLERGVYFVYVTNTGSSTVTKISVN